MYHYFDHFSYYRYKEYNVRNLEGYRAYSKNVPRFLRNRPKMFVNHCLARMPPKIDGIPEGNILQHNENVFKVKSINSANLYIVHFGEDLPHCTCADWKRNVLPCKHMLAIFHHYPACDWDFLPMAYRECPQFSLDPDVLQGQGVYIPQHQGPENIKEKEQLPVSLSQEKNSNILSPTSIDIARKDCLEVLKGIESTIHSISEVTRLATLKVQLTPIAEELQQSVELCDGLPLISCPLPHRRRRKVKRRQIFGNVHIDMNGTYCF